MKEFLDATTVVLVRGTREESINARPALAIAPQSFAQVLRDIAGIIVGIVGGLAYVAINQDGSLLLVAQHDQRHVAAVNWEKGERSWHMKFLFCGRVIVC